MQRSGVYVSPSRHNVRRTAFGLFNCLKECFDLGILRNLFEVLALGHAADKTAAAPCESFMQSRKKFVSEANASAFDIDSRIEQSIRESLSDVDAFCNRTLRRRLRIQSLCGLHALDCRITERGARFFHRPLTLLDRVDRAGRCATK